MEEMPEDKIYHSQNELTGDRDFDGPYFNDVELAFKNNCNIIIDSTGWGAQILSATKVKGTNTTEIKSNEEVETPMVKEQHKAIKGYRELSPEEIRLMNVAKELASKVGGLCNELKETEGIDHRWLDEGTIDLQKGFMSVIRSIAKPTSF